MRRVEVGRRGERWCWGRSHERFQEEVCIRNPCRSTSFTSSPSSSSFRWSRTCPCTRSQTHALGTETPAQHHSKPKTRHAHTTEEEGVLGPVEARTLQWSRRHGHSAPRAALRKRSQRRRHSSVLRAHRESRRRCPRRGGRARPPERCVLAVRDRSALRVQPLSPRSGAGERTLQQLLPGDIPSISRRSSRAHAPL